MKKDNIIMLLLCLVAITPVYAEEGDTIIQARARYGKPVGYAHEKESTILIYEIAERKIIETYDANGICIESEINSKKTKPILAKQIKSTYKKAKAKVLIKLSKALQITQTARQDKSTDNAKGKQGKGFLSPKILLIGIPVSIILAHKASVIPKRGKNPEAHYNGSNQTLALLNNHDHGNDGS